MKLVTPRSDCYTDEDRVEETQKTPSMIEPVQENCCTSALTAGSGAFISHVLSVRGVIALLCLVGIGLSGAATLVLSEISADDALDRTREQSSDALAKSFTTSEAALTRTVKEMLFYATTTSESTIKSFLQLSVIEAHRLAVLLGETEKDTDKSDIDAWCHSLTPRLWSSLATQMRAQTNAIWGVGVAAGPDSGLAGAAVVNRQGFLMTTLQYAGTAEFELGIALPPSGDILRDPAYHYQRLNGTDNAVLSATYSRMGVWEADSLRWGALENFSEFIGSIVIVNVPSTVDPNMPLQGMVYMTLSNIQSFLKTAAASTQNATGAETRIYTSIAHSWMAAKMESLGTFTQENITLQHQEGYLTGTSHGLGVHMVERYDAIFQNMTFLPEPMYDVNADDGVTNGVANAIHAYASVDPYLSISNEKTGTVVLTITRKIDNTTDFLPGSEDASFKTDLGNGMLQENHFVSVARVNDGYGIDWWLTVSLNQQHIMQSVVKTSRQVAEETEQEKAEVSDDVDTGRLHNRMIICGIAIGLVLISLVVTSMVLRPISVIQGEMHRVANLNFRTLEETVVASSPLYEVRLMQTDFLQMAANLIEYKAYVPDAVRGGDSNGSGIFDPVTSKVVAPPTGEVCIMFTDIQGSTPLWKKSASDMNEAIELHNELIRAAYLAYGGYEVKTIGDAFMIAYSDAVNAVRTGLEIHHKFKQAKWPSGLGLPSAGLVLRIGIHKGQTIAEENPITGRTDYRGSTVNMAARLEGKAKGGTVCITPDVLADLEASKDGVKGLPHSPTVHAYGMHGLKGLGEGHDLSLLTPGYLSNRYNDAKSDTKVATNFADGLTIPIPGRGPSADDRSQSDVSSIKSRVDRSLGGMALGMKKTELYLQKSVGTVVVCRLTTGDGTGASLFDDFNLVVRSAAESALSLDGQVCVASSSVTVFWNTAKKCKQHLTAALRFAEYLETRLDGVTLGISTGTLSHGNVGTLKQRYTTSFGVPVLAAEAAAEYAEESSFFACFADATHEGRSLERNNAERVSECLFLCDVWFFQRSSLRLDVYQMNCSVLTSLLKGWGRGSDSEPTTVLENSSVAGREEVLLSNQSTDLFKKAMKSKSKEDLDGFRSQIVPLATGSPVAGHHHRVLSDARMEDIACGYRKLVELSRAPLLPPMDCSMSLSFTRRPTKPEAAPEPPRSGWISIPVDDVSRSPRSATSGK